MCSTYNMLFVNWHKVSASILAVSIADTFHVIIIIIINIYSRRRRHWMRQVGEQDDDNELCKDVSLAN